MVILILSITVLTISLKLPKPSCIDSDSVTILARVINFMYSTPPSVWNTLLWYLFDWNTAPTAPTFNASIMVFTLPSTLLADRPAENRDESRLMVINRQDGSIEHKVFKDIYNYFDDQDIMIVNDTKVFPARIFGNKEKTGAKIEVFLLRELNAEQLLWDVMVDPARKIRIGNKLYFGEDNILVAEVIDNTTSRGRTLRFLYDGSYDEFKETLNHLGETPLPKYIKRAPDEDDRERYQTIYADFDQSHSVAAPTAGLHFDEQLLAELDVRGVERVPITLHVGAGTFKSIETATIEEHAMHEESWEVSQKTLDSILRAKNEDRAVIAVGTTSVRTLESLPKMHKWPENGGLSGETRLMITPPYAFKVVDGMLTNFHLPKSTLLTLVAAMIGIEQLKLAYAEAIALKYRFYSYGDAMFFCRKEAKCSIL